MYNTYFNAKKGTYYVLTFLKRPVIQIHLKFTSKKAFPFSSIWYTIPFNIELSKGVDDTYIIYYYTNYKSSLLYIKKQ